MYNQIITIIKSAPPCLPDDFLQSIHAMIRYRHVQSCQSSADLCILCILFHPLLLNYSNIIWLRTSEKATYILSIRTH